MMTEDMRKRKEYIGTCLKKLGVGAHFSGYYFLRHAIELSMDAMQKKDVQLLTCRICKDLYPEIAKEFHTTPAKVERGIRTAVEEAMLIGNTNYIEEVFQYSIDPERGKPSNAAFIATVADYLYCTPLKNVTQKELDLSDQIKHTLLFTE